MVAKIRPVRVTRFARELRVDFFKACAIARFRNQFARGQKTIGSHLKFDEEQAILPLKSCLCENKPESCQTRVTRSAKLWRLKPKCFSNFSFVTTVCCSISFFKSSRGLSMWSSERKVPRFKCLLCEHSFSCSNNLYITELSPITVPNQNRR